MVRRGHSEADGRGEGEGESRRARVQCPAAISSVLPRPALETEEAPAPLAQPLSVVCTVGLERLSVGSLSAGVASK